MNIRNRIEKIEAVIKQSSKAAVLLREPAEDADKEAHSTFEAAIAEAHTAGHTVVVHTSGKEPRQRIAGVIYESDSFSAMCTLMAHSPATDGRSKDKLCQIIAAVQGTTLPVVSEVRNGTL